LQRTPEKSLCPDLPWSFHSDRFFIGKFHHQLSAVENRRKQTNGKKQIGQEKAFMTFGRKNDGRP